MNARKTISLVLVSTAISAFGLPGHVTQTTLAASSTKTTVTDGHYTIGSVSAQEQEAYNYVNSDRSKYGLPNLQLDPQLCALARTKSRDMVANKYFAHESPTLGNVRTMLKNAGYSFAGAGENIARHATVLKSHASFLSSAGHRRNIMSANWTKIGVGVALDANGFVYLTQIFAR